MRLATLAIASMVMVSSANAAGPKPYLIGYDETKSLVSNETMVSYDRSHGTQVEFNAKNGKTYLFYPGNTVIVKGQWKLNRTNKPNVFDMCFKYPSQSYNPVTKDWGGSWECQPAGFYLAGMIDHATGDVLGLAKRDKVPFVLKKRKAKLANLVKLLPH